jgi:large subunit ribosomal protein L21
MLFATLATRGNRTIDHMAPQMRCIGPKRSPRIPHGNSIASEQGSTTPGSWSKSRRFVSNARPGQPVPARYFRQEGDMYAIIHDGGRQYRVEEGQELDVDYRELQKGQELTFDRVLAVSGSDGLKLGKPTVAGGNVIAKVLGPVQGDKLYIQKFRRRKNYRRRTGHRQMYLKVRIDKIQAS